MHRYYKINLSFNWLLFKIMQNVEKCHQQQKCEIFSLNTRLQYNYDTQINLYILIIQNTKQNYRFDSNLKTHKKNIFVKSKNIFKAHIYLISR